MKVFRSFFVPERKFLRESEGKLQVAYREPFLLYDVIKDQIGNINEQDAGQMILL